MAPKKNVLVVEDNEINREMLGAILNDEYNVLRAENGRQALDILQMPDAPEVSLILLDVMMPVMDGYTLLGHLTADPELSLIPVIVTTQSDGVADELNALSHGATDFVPKPYHGRVIRRRVANLIKLRETAAMVNLLQTDRLTGVYTKEYFCQKARDWMNQNPDTPCDVVCMNIVNFKLFNDLFGTQNGNRLLCELSSGMSKICGRRGVFGRQSADRFMMLIPHEVEYTEEMFTTRVDELKALSPSYRGVTLKWGIYPVTDRTVPVEQMTDRAFLAADTIKNRYNQSFTYYDDMLRTRLLYEQAITEAMEPALEQHQFEVYLQPKYRLSDERPSGAEALVRWTHPELGFLSPGVFIPLFERNGFITRLDRFVWEEVCRLLQRWKQQGRPVLPVSVNVSRADIYQADLVDVLDGLLKTYDVDPRDLHLEVTESAYTENSDQIIQTVERLRKRGFVVEMDDFGSGYSSLNMLTQLGLDVLKLDMKFIQSEMAKPEEKGILRFIVELAHSMGLEVVAEGVETRDEVERLRAMHCDYAQGYYFARPMSVPQYEALDG